MSAHEQIWELIPDFLKGRLTEADSRLVEEHIRDCAECREWMEECRALDSDLEEFARIELADHPDLELLGLFASSPKKVSDGDAASLKLHLEVCPKCKRIVDAAAEMGRQEFAAGVPAGALVPKVSILGSLFELVKRPAFAYGIAAVAVLAMLWPVGGQRLNGTDSGSHVVQEVVQLAELTRNLSNASGTTIPSTKRIINLRVDFRGMADYRYTAVIQSDRGDALMREQLSPEAVAQGSIIIRLASNTSPGKYSVVIVGTSPSGETTMTYYPFTVTR